MCMCFKKYIFKIMLFFFIFSKINLFYKLLFKYIFLGGFWINNIINLIKNFCLFKKMFTLDFLKYFLRQKFFFKIFLKNFYFWNLNLKITFKNLNLRLKDNLSTKKILTSLKCIFKVIKIISIYFRIKYFE